MLFGHHLNSVITECVSDIPVKEKICYQGLIDSKGEEGMQLALGTW